MQFSELEKDWVRLLVAKNRYHATNVLRLLVDMTVINLKRMSVPRK